jgi:endo-1,4-beta-xylanase
MIRYVTRVGAHFAGKVDSYTVVNEAFDTNGHLVSSAWNTTGDDSYIFDAFRAARQADPRAKLFYNDFGGEDINPKSDAIFALAKRLHQEKTAVIIGGRTHLRPLIDGVGLQMHVGVQPGETPDPDSVRKNISRLGRAGLRVRITEMDVRIPVPGGVASAVDRQRQHDLYRDLAQTCLTASSCEGVTFWGFTDAHSWITENAQLFPGQGAAHLFDTKYQPKPAYDAIRAALERFAARASPSGASAGWRSSALIGGALTAGRPRVSAGGTRPCGSSPAR